MNMFNSFVNEVVIFFFRVLSFAPPIISLAVLSALSGVVMLFFFAKFSDRKAIGAVKRLVQAHLLELRIYRDEPRVMWAAQKSLFASNLRYMALMLLPALWMILPFSLLLVRMEAIYGRAPAPVGQPAIVTMALRTPIDPNRAAPQLVAPDGVVVETPPLRVLPERQISWRVRPVAPVSAMLQIHMDGVTVPKRMEAGGGPRFVPGRSVSSMFGSLWHPDEPRIAAPDVDWVDITYPDATFGLFGIHMSWIVWFFLISMISALLLKKRFRVTF